MNNKRDDEGQALAVAIFALTSNLRGAQADRALDLVMVLTDVSGSEEGARAILALAPKMTAVPADQVLHDVLFRLGSEALDQRYFFDPISEKIQALAPMVTAAAAGGALDEVLRSIGKTHNADVLQALAQAIAALAPKLTEAPDRQALDPIFQQIGRTDDPAGLQALALAIRALAPKLTEAEARELSDLAQASLAWAGSNDEAADWARSLVALLDRADGSGTTQKLIATVAFPAAAGVATDILLDAIRATAKAAPTKEAGTIAALEWLGANYSDVLPLVCPPPPRPYDISQLKCQMAEAQSAVGAVAPAQVK